MKKLFKTQLSIILVFVFVLCSCSKDDETKLPPPPDTKTLLTGKIWSLVKGGTDDNKNGKIDDSEIKVIPENAFLYLIFKADGTGIQSANGSLEPLIWFLVDEQTISFKLNTSNYIRIKTLTANKFDFDIYNDSNTIITTSAQCVPK